MAIDRDAERERDKATLDRLISALEQQTQGGNVLMASDKLVKALERRAALLGLDFAPEPAAQAETEPAGSMAAVERRLGLVVAPKSS
jgi:hypothetical protein